MDASAISKRIAKKVLHPISVLSGSSQLSNTSKGFSANILKREQTMMSDEVVIMRIGQILVVDDQETISGHSTTISRMLLDIFQKRG